MVVLFRHAADTERRLLRQISPFVMKNREKLGVCFYLNKGWMRVAGISVRNRNKVLHLTTCFMFEWQQDVWSGDSRIRRVAHTEQSGNGIGLQFLPTSWRPGYFLKLTQLKVILGERGHVQGTHAFYPANNKQKYRSS